MFSSIPRHTKLNLDLYIGPAIIADSGGDVVVHIFLPPQREFYNLEEFYGNAKSIELPFEDEKPFLRYRRISADLLDGPVDPALLDVASNMVMAARPNKVYIPFEPLLQKITAIVSDFTYDQIRLHELCMKLFRNKCAELLQEKGKSPQAVAGESSGRNFAIDAIETTWVEGHGFVSWVMVNCPLSNNGMECIFSELCPLACIAEKRVSKKVVFYLACKYNLEIVDASYGATAKMSRECYLLREKYLILKGHLQRLELPCLEAAGTNPAAAKRKKILQLAHERDLGEGPSKQAASGLLELGQMLLGSGNDFFFL
uniref:Uncharacterized protein n=1 Tax=Chenopodium quinoa TaxID=63459 RepID=A0A803N214_CHEQI